MKLSEWIEKNRVKIDIEWVVSRPDGLMDKSQNHYCVTVYGENDYIEVYFSTGKLADFPEAEDVLSCVASDCRFIEDNPDFDSFCFELGYDPDSRSAEKIYKACCDQYKMVKDLFGDGAFEEFLDCDINF